MDDQLRVVQIGVGGFGARRRQLMRQTGLFRLLASHDRSPDAMAAAQRDDGATPCATFEELLATPGAEALIVSTGASDHCARIVAAMERGLHVFTEKPLCATPAEVETLLALRSRHPRQIIGIGHNPHDHLASSTALKRAIDGGELGSIVAIEKTTGHSGGLHIKPGDWRGDPAKNPGGMLFQCGVHAFHELMYLFGPIAGVQASMRHDVHTTLTADAAQCLVRFASGLVGTVCAYHVIPYRHHLTILGTKANIYRDERYGPAGTTALIQRGRLDGGFEVQEPFPLAGEDDPTAGLRAWHAAVRRGSDAGLYPGLIDGVRAVEVVFAAEESARTGRAVALPHRRFGSS